MQFFTINVSHSINHLRIDRTVPEWWKQKDFNKYLKFQIFYSMIIYLICFFGFIKLFNSNNENKKFSYLIIFIVLYYTTLLGWTGIPRYNVPNLLFISIFFGYGVNHLIRKFN